jgi:hypothetical protein
MKSAVAVLLAVCTFSSLAYAQDNTITNVLNGIGTAEKSGGMPQPIPMQSGVVPAPPPVLAPAPVLQQGQTYSGPFQSTVSPSGTPLAPHQIVNGLTPAPTPTQPAYTYRNDYYPHGPTFSPNYAPPPPPPAVHHSFVPPAVWHPIPAAPPVVAPPAWRHR